ncbi:MAG: Gfo/Idh/MocA family oxidoreductase, partial [Armatimonadetes bacterium]|nr:Gfo/Idh/MocA family oxidoreductase [Armatimonadota bacterium]
MLGCAVIGTGRMGLAHARVWQQLPTTHLVAVYDVDADRAAQVASELDCQADASLQALLERDEVDIVSVCTPDDAHVEPCLAAAAAGKHILLEKPLATTTADADRIIAAAEGAGVKLMVGQILRFDPHYAVAYRQAQEGALGDLIYAYARRYNLLRDGRRIAPHSSVMAFLGIHDLDALQWITGRRVVRVFAVGASKLMADARADDAIVATLQFDNGACGCVDTLWVNPEGTVSSLDARMELVGTAGRVDVRVAHDGVVVSDATRALGLDTT